MIHTIVETPLGPTTLLAAFTAILAGVFFRSAIFVGLAFLWLRLSDFARRRRVFRMALPEGQVRSELLAAIHVLLLDAAAITSVIYAGWLRHSPSTVANTIVTFLLMFALFEVWFYVTHRAMHTKALFFLHRQHHVAQVTDPLTSLSFSLIERAILLIGALGAAILLSWTIGISVAGMWTYAIANYALNVLGHSNVEVFPAWFTKSRLGRWLVTPTYHALHHARYGGHYGLFTSVLDRAFGSVYPDYEAVQERASAGQGLTRQGERLKPADGCTEQPLVPKTIRPKVEIRS
jgi:Delta7-sterol 5-desaturase